MISQTPSQSSVTPSGTIDHHIIALMRLVLAASALLISVIDPAEPGRLVALTYTVLGLYTIYSALIYIFVLGHGRSSEPIYRWMHWADVGWYTIFVALSRGTGSIFFFFFFFAILVASFLWGFREGLRVTLGATLLFTGVGLAIALQGSEFELNRFLLRPIYLLVLGSMMAYWGGFEATLKRRLALLKEMTLLSNPRFGVDRATGIILEQVRTFYHADACLTITIDPGTGEHRMRRTARHNPEGAARVEIIPAALGQQLLAPPAEAVLVYRGRPPTWLPSQGGYRGYDVKTGVRVAADQPESEALAALIDAASFISIPLYYNHDPFGRLYVTASRPRAFGDSDADFLLQVSAHVTPILDNIRIVDWLASDAAEEERKRIARDIHDSVIQPYIGLQMGIAAIRQKLAAGQEIATEVERLYYLTTEGIDELRGYVRELRSGGDRDSGLVASVRRFAGKLAATTGLEVRVDAPDHLRINDRLAAEVFQIVAEGLSNVRRHTQAVRATVYLARDADRLTVRVENERMDGAEPTSFAPRSIFERARALGGSARVDQREERTTVIVEIPL